MPLTQISALSDAGSQTDAYNQAILNNQIAAYDYNQTLPLQMLGTYDSFINGNYGGTTVTQQPYYNNSSSNSLGMALGGAGIGASIGGPYGAAAGGLTGLLLSMSDKTLKENIEPARHLLDDVKKLKVHAFSYKTERALEPTHVGVMAQELEEEFPYMVGDVLWNDGSTKKMVNYAQLVPFLIGAVQELSTKVIELEAHIAHARRQ
jgi:hypothetical protein